MLFRSTDGGETWKLQFTGNRKEFFLDALKCVSEKECLALSDPVDGKFLLLKTTDGEHWNPVPGDKMPAALPTEGAFAASNSSLIFSGQEILFGTGGPAARVFNSLDSGRTWTVTETPIAHGNASSGIFSIARGTVKTIVVVGGDYQDPKRTSGTAAYSKDDGKTWRLGEVQPGGYRSAVARIKGSRLAAVGPNGEDSSHDLAMHWKHMDSLNLNAVAFLDLWMGWAVGPKGTIARFVNQDGFDIRYRDPQDKQLPTESGIAE